MPVQLRANALLCEGTVVRFNLDRVLTISSSYTDELFGVLVLEAGSVRVLNQSVLVNASDPVARTIAEVIVRRGLEGGEDPLKYATN